MLIFFFFDKICIVLLKCWLIKYILTFPKIQLVLSHGFDEAFFFFFLIILVTLFCSQKNLCFYFIYIYNFYFKNLIYK